MALAHRHQQEPLIPQRFAQLLLKRSTRCRFGTSDCTRPQPILPKVRHNDMKIITREGSEHGWGRNGITTVLRAMNLLSLSVDRLSRKVHNLGPSRLATLV